MSADNVANGDMVSAMKKEIYQNGPILCHFDDIPILKEDPDPLHI